ncbi:MAG: nucleotidyltransferase family protein [Clostridia bacterium]|nr:nucleotidyltransferase family protein [Clostridia bacterium]
MNAVGIICEYNPFHRGHALHIARAREASGADYVVCVMSGPFTQRGAPARHDKWTRAHAALSCGADLVLELPVRFACASAQEFAAGGVGILASLGVVSHLSFGCEAEALPLLSHAAQAMTDESPAFAEALREGLDQGMSYPRARAAAVLRSQPELESALSLPNAALALEYLQAMPQGMIPVPVEREGSGYHDGELSHLSSATGVRAALERGDLQAAMDALPAPDRFAAAEAQGDLCEEDALSQALIARLRTISAPELSQISGMDEGLEHRFIAAAQKCSTRKKLIETVKTRRYTWARLSRLSTLALLGVTRELAQAYPAPVYARILGFRRSAAPLLRAIADRGSIPLITKAADYDQTHPLYALDARAQDLWSLGCAEPSLRAGGRDFTTPPVIL